MNTYKHRVHRNVIKLVQDEFHDNSANKKQKKETKRHLEKNK